jgi:hypothetical protein
MNYKAVTLLCILISPLPLMAIEWPSHALDEHPQSVEMVQKNVAEHAESRAALLEWVWHAATRTSSVDNRAYLFALSMDLYNSIPPDLNPKSIVRPGEDVYEANLKPVKEQWFYNMAMLHTGNEESLADKMTKWSWMKQNLDSQWFLEAVEMEYIRHFIRDQIVQGNIVFDSKDAQASVDPARLDILNPVHYEVLETFIDENRESIEQGIPPWEATVQPAQVKAVAGKIDAKPLTAQAEKQGVTSFVQNLRLWTYVLVTVLLVFGAGGVGYIVLRKRRR